VIRPPYNSYVTSDLMRSGNPFLDSMEAIVGKLTDRRVRALRDESVSYVVGLQRELVQLDSLPEAVPPKDVQAGGHVRPYLPQPPYNVSPGVITSRPPPDIDYYDPLVLDVYRGHASDEAVARYLRYIARRLLFCHSVAIDDPLTFTLPTEGPPTYARALHDEQWEVRRTLNALNCLARLRPLIASNLVIPIPRYEQWYRQWWFRDNGHAPDWYMDAVGYPDRDSDGGSADLDRPLVSLTGNLITEPVQEIVMATGMESERAPLLDSIDDATIRVSRFIRCDGRVDFDLPTDEMSRIGLVEVLAQEAADAGVLDSYVEAQSVRVRTLVEIPIPALDEISVDAVLRLHHDADAFTAWRLSLAQALDRIAHDVDLEQPDSEDTARRIILEHTWPTINGLAKTKFSAPGLLQGGLQRLVLGALPVATGLLSHSPAAGLATAAGSAAVATAWTYAASGAGRLTAGAATAILDALSDSATGGADRSHRDRC
jgi:hypothetical protein